MALTNATILIEVKDQLTVISGDTLITDTMVQRWINLALDWALNFKRWPFLQKKSTDLIDATGTYPYPANIKTKSIYLITVGGKRYNKIRYDDYLKYLEDNSTGTDKVWAEFDRDTFINGNACAVGDAVAMYGYEITADMTASETTPFGAAEPVGDEAIIKYAVAKGLKKIGGMTADAANEINEAKDILNAIWHRIEEAMPKEVLKNTPRLRKIDILGGTTSGPGNNRIGNF